MSFKYKLGQKVICYYVDKKHVESGIIIALRSADSAYKNMYEVKSDAVGQFVAYWFEENIEPNIYNFFIKPYTLFIEYEILIKQRQSIEAWK